MYSLLYFRRKRRKYDIICSENVRIHALFMMIALVGFDINGSYAYIFGAISKLLIAWIFLADILLLTVVHNIGVYKYRREKRMAQERKGEATEEAKGSDQKRQAGDSKNTSG